MIYIVLVILGVGVANLVVYYVFKIDRIWHPPYPYDENP